MNQLSNLTPSGSRSWLRSVHEQRKNRSIQLGMLTIDTLISNGIPVTYKNIHEKSKELDVTGKGIHSNTIKRNEELYSYYKQYSKTFKIKQNKKKTAPQTTFDESTIRNISPSRNILKVRSKYMKLSKEELVDKLIQTEQYLARNHQKWVTGHFEMFKLISYLMKNNFSEFFSLYKCKITIKLLNFKSSNKYNPVLNLGRGYT
jgi:hypothetical protein